MLPKPLGKTKVSVILFSGDKLTRFLPFTYFLLEFTGLVDPKSLNNTLQLAWIRMLAGLMSRCMRFVECKNSKAVSKLNSSVVI